MKNLLFTAIFLLLSACVFKVEVPSAKSKLERQVLGYQPMISKESMLNAVTRASGVKSNNKENLIALRERLERQVIVSLKRGVVGESATGKLVLMSRDKWTTKFSASSLSYIKDLMIDENDARMQLSKLENRSMNEYGYRSESGAWVESSSGGWKLN